MTEEEKIKFLQALREDEEFAMSIHFIIEQYINKALA